MILPLVTSYFAIRPGLGQSYWRAFREAYFGYFGYFGMFEEIPQLSTSGSAQLLVTIQSNKLLLLAAM